MTALLNKESEITKLAPFEKCRYSIVLYILFTPKKIYKFSSKAKNTQKIRPKIAFLGNTANEKSLLY